MIYKVNKLLIINIKKTKRNLEVLKKPLKGVKIIIINPLKLLIKKRGYLEIFSQKLFIKNYNLLNRKITFSIDEIKGDSIFGHSITAGNISQFKGLVFQNVAALVGWYVQDKMEVMLNGRRYFIDKTGRKSKLKHP